MCYDRDYLRELRWKKRNGVPMSLEEEWMLEEMEQNENL